MHTFRSDETMFEGDDLGDAHALELDVLPRTCAPTLTSTSTPPPTPTSTRPPTWPPASTSTWPPPSTYTPPARLVSSNALVTAMSEIPMSIWKRVAVYPLALFLILYLIMPCRLNGRATLVMFVIGAIGTAGAWIRYRAHDRLD